MTGTEKPTVVVGVSPSPSGRRALRRAIQEAEQRGARLHLLRVWRDTDHFSPMTNAEIAALRAQERAEMAILSDATAFAQQLSPDLDIAFEFAPGELDATLSGAARDADLVVLGAGQPEVSGTRVAQRYVDRLPCPVLIVDPPIRVTPPAVAAAGAH